MSVLAAAIGCAPIAAGAQSEQSPSEFPGEPAAYLALVEGESVGEGEGAGEGESAGFGEGDGADEIEIASAGEIEGAGESEGEGSSSGDGDGAPAGRIAYWPFDENGGATAADVVGGATAAISAGAWREGRYGSAIGFAEFGGAARINAPGGALDRLGELSMGMW
ncbi:MAG: hypothetical protein LBL83_07455, partial [Clostridiales bacterium]|nr:hypothetical protein [Clostridiales bacterium]